MSQPASGGRTGHGVAARMAAGRVLDADSRALKATQSEVGTGSVRKDTQTLLKPSKPIQHSIPVEPREWRLWFPARVSSAPTRRTATGKQKRKPPALPPNINERRAMNWHVEQKLVAYWRLLAKTTAGEAGIPPLEQALISAVVYRRAMGVADEDGDFSRLKPLVDGLRDAGVIRDDTRGYVRYGGVAEQRAGADGPGITLIVREI